MKLGFISDVHLTRTKPQSRIDDFNQAMWSKMCYFLDWCAKENAIPIQAGDFFDVPRDWFILSRLMYELKQRDLLIYTIYGSHDQYYRSKEEGATSLGILDTSEMVRILGKEAHPIHGWNFYGAGWNEDIPEPSTEKNILVIHENISEGIPYSGADYFEASGFLNKYIKFDIILCGHIHQYFFDEQNGRYILNTGPMLRAEATEYNMSHKPSFMEINLSENDIDFTCHELPFLPSNQVLTREHIESKKEKLETLSKFSEGLSSIQNLTINVLDNLYSFMEESKVGKEVFNYIDDKVKKLTVQH